MKNLIYFIAISVFFFSSCCNDGSKSDSDGSTTGEEAIVTEEIIEGSDEETEAVEEEETKINNCDEFLDEYEVWITDYLDLLEMFKKNPTDPALSQKYMKVTQEASTWTQQWIKFAECGEKEEYQQRFDEISEMVDEKMEELEMN